MDWRRVYTRQQAENPIGRRSLLWRTLALVVAALAVGALDKWMSKPRSTMPKTSTPAPEPVVARPAKPKSRSVKRRPSWRAMTAVPSVVVVIAGTLFFFAASASASSAWTQSSWTGGVGPSTGNQYASQSGLDTSAGNLRTQDRNDWFNAAWSYRKQITFDNTAATLGTPAEDLIDFPVLVKLTSANFDFTKAQSAGQDIRFTDSDGTTALNYEIDSWSTVGQTATMWVKVPKIDSESLTDSVFIYYGNVAATDGQSATNTWDSNFSSVFHMKEPSGTSMADSTSSARTGTAGTGATVTTGAFGNARSFNGTANVSNVQTNLTNGATVTVSAWIQTTVTPLSGISRMIWNRQASVGPDLWLNGGKFYLNTWDSNNNPFCNAPANINDGNFHEVFTVDSPSVVKLYVDGALCGTAVYKTPAGAFMLGSNSSFEWQGKIDEVRVSTVVRSAAYAAADYKTATTGFSSYGAEQTVHVTTSGTLTSSIFSTAVELDWGTLTYSASTPAGTSVAVKVRSGALADLSDASVFTTCAALSSGVDATSTCAPDRKRYVQYQVVLTTTSPVNRPTFSNLSLNYSNSDTTPPGQPGAFVLQRTSGSTALAPNSWVNVAPYVSWPAAVDTGGSGLKGYCAYVGQDVTADPVTTKGFLGSSPSPTDGACQYLTSAASINLAAAGVLGSSLLSSTSPYYLVLKPVDNANNLATATSSVAFRFDNTAPTPPAFISAPSSFLSTKAVPLIWASAGSEAANDTTSGLVGLQYRIGPTGTWYGENHTGAQDISDVLVNDGSYTTQPTPDFDNIPDGTTVVYFRALDAAGNVSTSLASAIIRVNSTAPSAPTSLQVSPETNTQNAFAFTWNPPATYQGPTSSITYCYTVNKTPTANNCSFTQPGQTQLPVDAYATQPGLNTMYIVAKDEAGNISYPVYASIDFTANTPAPGVPMNAEIADVSNKPTSNWKLALSWNAPGDVGSGVNSYKVFRSDDGVTYTAIATTAGTSYVDAGLVQKSYNYQIRACDSANNCGAISESVGRTPTGRFTSPAEMVKDPEVTASTRTAAINWVTDRASDSRIQYGTASGQYLPTESSNSDQVQAHALQLTNLLPGTVYFYRVKWVDEDGNVGTSPEQTFTTAPSPTVGAVNVGAINVSAATVSFTTTNAVAVKLLYGPSEGLGGLQSLNTSTATSAYSIHLEGLQDGATYFYKIVPTDVDGNDYDPGVTLQFHTPARPHISNIKFEPVIDGSSNSEKVTWTTNVATDGEIDYGLVGETRRPIADAAMRTQHEMIVRNLADNSVYSMVAKSRDTAGNLPRVTRTSSAPRSTPVRRKSATYESRPQFEAQVRNREAK